MASLASVRHVATCLGGDARAKFEVDTRGLETLPKITNRFVELLLPRYRLGISGRQGRGVGWESKPRKKGEGEVQLGAKKNNVD